MSSHQFPTPLEIKALAEDYGYSERRPEASRTLFFQETPSAETGSNAPTTTRQTQQQHHQHQHQHQPVVLINVFYTTRGIMTKLPHPATGHNSLWRSSAYDSLEALAMLFEDPRTHAGRGYRQAREAVRGCGRCGDQKRRGEYSASQWRAKPGESVCSGCVVGGGGGGADDNGGGERTAGGNGGGGKNKENGGGNNNHNNNSNSKNRAGIANNDRSDDGGNNGGNDYGNRGGFPPLSVAAGNGNSNNNSNNPSSSFPRLSEESLKQHEKTTTTTAKVKHQLERRQFNCPLCPEEGRGKTVFFKKVPAEKPIVKCAKCKRVKKGDCERLYPIPKGEEKGYGHYRCGRCESTWGSSRAVMAIGQACHACTIDPSVSDATPWVKPFRIEVVRRSGGIAGGGARPAGRNMRRKPREPIGEDEECEGGYTRGDGMRYRNPGNALLGTNANGGAVGGFGGGGADGGGGGGGTGFDWVPTTDDEDRRRPPARSRLSQYKAAHKCEGCATGACRSRKLPVSGVHDVHDGDTASTSGSIVTNSEIDKSEFVDRDLDFDEWEEDDGSEVWVTMGSNGKMLRG